MGSCVSVYHYFNGDLLRKCEICNARFYTNSTNKYIVCDQTCAIDLLTKLDREGVIVTDNIAIG